MQRRFLVVWSVCVVTTLAGLAGCCQARNWKGRYFRSKSTVHIRSVETTTSSASSTSANKEHSHSSSGSDLNPNAPGIVDASQRSYNPDSAWQPNNPHPETPLNDGAIQDSPLLDEAPRESYQPIEVSPVFRDPT
jgi:hypothetical protein